MNKLIGIFFIALLLSGCSKVREQTFLNDLCQPRNDRDEEVCKCMFEVLDKKLSKTVGETWVYNPNFATHPSYQSAMSEAEKCDYSVR